MVLLLSWRLFWRDLKSGELKILMLALWIAIGGLSSMTLLVDRIEKGMVKDAREVLGADLIVRSPEKIKETWKNHALNKSLKQSLGLRFSSVVVSGDHFQLSTIKAVDNAFPLLGHLMIQHASDKEAEITYGTPQLGEVWVAPRLLPLLKTQIGESIQIGVKTFTISGVIDKEPGANNFFNFSPTVIMALDDVAATEIIQVGSRLDYQFSVIGNDDDINDFYRWIKEDISPRERLSSLANDAPSVDSALSRASHYLNLSGILGLLLGGIAIAISAHRYAVRHYDHAALLRCMGMTPNKVIIIFCWVLFYAGLIGALLGSLTGFLVSEFLILLLADFLPKSLPSVNPVAIVIAVMMGFVVLIGFALPILMSIRHVTPMRVLRRDLTPRSVSNWLILLSSTIALSFVLWLYVQDLMLVLMVVGLSAFVLFIYAVLSNALLKLAKSYFSRSRLFIRLAFEHLYRYRMSTLIQISAFGLALTLLLTLLVVRNELISDWQAQLPDKAPNHFLVNIHPDDAQEVTDFFEEHTVAMQALYPVIPGRIIKVKDQNLNQYYGEKLNSINALKRDLNLTGSKFLSPSNKVIQGDWHQGQQVQNQATISVESGFAKSLNIGIGDRLTFLMAGQEISASISSIREVDWQSFEPNFYVIFDEKSLSSIPFTYLTSFYLPPEQKGALNLFIQQFPTISVLEVDQLLKQVKNVLNQVSLIVEMILFFLVIAGLLVLFATTKATLDEKYYESALLRTFGASRRLLNSMVIVQYSILAMFAAILAIAATQAIIIALYDRFNMSDIWQSWLWWLAPLLALCIIVPAGFLSHYRVQRVSPQSILREG